MLTITRWMAGAGGGGRIARGRWEMFSRAIPLAKRILAGGLLITLFASGATVHGSDVPAIAAASDLKFVLEELNGRFRKETRRELRLTFGSSGNFYTQIMQGAPFQMFLSADEALVFGLADAGKTLDRGAIYAVGRIVLFAPHASPLKVDVHLEGLRDLLAKGELRRLAIAHPAHAPYGRAAEQALRAAGLWEAVLPRLVLGENVSQAAQFAMSGSAQGGIIANSIAIAAPLQSAGKYVLLAESMHQPLRQRAVLLRGAGDTAKAFFAFIGDPAARSLFKRYGFVLPSE